MNLEKLKDAARKHEQREEWRKAIEVYQRILEGFESGADNAPDLAIYNKVGDLLLKVGDVPSAVHSYERAADLYTQARVVLNEAIAGDLNMRVFEALATRSLLLTPDVPGLADLFQDGVHLVTYRDGDHADALDKLRYWADPVRDADRETIAEAGYRAVLAGHTMRHRVAALLAPMGFECARSPRAETGDARARIAATT